VDAMAAIKVAMRSLVIEAPLQRITNACASATSGSSLIEAVFPPAKERSGVSDSCLRAVGRALTRRFRRSDAMKSEARQGKSAGDE